MENSAIGIVYDKNELGGCFVCIGDEEALTKSYR
jgi:hypothetical protein